MTVAPSPGAKMQYLIRRKPGISRADLIANWFANHMPGVIANQRRSAERGRPAASRYVATIFEPDASGEQVWDGVAQLTFAEPLPRPDWPHGDPPRDEFQERAEPYLPWATTEHVVLDGLLPLRPNEFAAPFPCTRSGFVKVTTLVVAKPDSGPDDHAAFFDHWLQVHAPNVATTMEQVGGLRYVINISIEPEVEPYLGSAEVWFPGPTELAAFNAAYQTDGIEELVDFPASPILRSTTEMIGIP